MTGPLLCSCCWSIYRFTVQSR